MDAQHHQERMWLPTSARQGESFGVLLKHHRQARGLTQEELAERAEISARGLRALERAERGKPYRTTVSLLAGALNLSPPDRAAFVAAARGTFTIPDGPIGAFLGARPVGPLIDRGPELSQIEQLVETVRGGAGRLLLLAGDAGTGKTRLAQATSEYLRQREFLVASGRCYEPQQSVPFYPFLDVLEAVFAAAPATTRSDAGRRWPYLSHLLPEQLGIHPLVSAEALEDQQRLCRAVAGFLMTVAEVTPVGLLIDDIHWMDAASLDLLQYLARQTRGCSILLVATYRDGEIGQGHPLERVLLDVDREDLAELVVVRPLSSEGTTALTAVTMGETEIEAGFATLVHLRTGGNPFFVRQVLHALMEHGEIYREDGRWSGTAVENLPVPASIRAVIEHRVARFTPSTREILREASVLGQTFTFDDLRGISRKLEDEVECALEEAITAGMVREIGDDHFTFDHALTKDTLYASLVGRRKRRLHLAAGEAIEQLPDRTRERRAAELARHFVHAKQAERAIPWALLAGDQAEALFAHAEAEWQYRTALELAQESENPKREAEALEKLGGMLALTGRSSEALDLLTRAMAMYQDSDDNVGWARAAIRVGWAHWGTGCFMDGIVVIREVLTSLGESAPPSVLASLWVVLSSLLLHQNRQDEALTAAEQATEFAQRAGDDRLLGQAEGRRGLLLQVLGRLDDAMPVLQRAIALSKAAGDLDTLNRALNNLGANYRDRGDFASARQYRERGLAVAIRTGDAYQVSFIGKALADLGIQSGDWEAARLYAEQTLEALQSLGGTALAAIPLLTLAWLNREEDHLSEARRCFTEAAQLAAHSNDWQVSWAMESMSAEWEMEDGLASDAVDRLEHLLAQPDLQRYPKFWFSDLLAQAYLAAGMTEKADETAQCVADLSTEYGEIHLHQEGRRAVANLRARQGRWEEAERTFETALTVARSGRRLFPMAEILYEYGLAEKEKGDRDRARDLLQQALALFEQVGATARFGRTKRVLAELS